MLPDPKFFEHGIELFPDVNVVVQSQFDHFFVREDFLVLVFEQDLAERI